jgi:hypothetical protein
VTQGLLNKQVFQNKGDVVRHVLLACAGPIAAEVAYRAQVRVHVTWGEGKAVPKEGHRGCIVSAFEVFKPFGQSSRASLAVDQQDSAVWLANTEVRSLQNERQVAFELPLAFDYYPLKGGAQTLRLVVLPCEKAEGEVMFEEVEGDPLLVGEVLARDVLNEGPQQVEMSKDGISGWRCTVEQVEAFSSDTVRALKDLLKARVLTNECQVQEADCQALLKVGGGPLACQSLVRVWGRQQRVFHTTSDLLQAAVAQRLRAARMARALRKDLQTLPVLSLDVRRRLSQAQVRWLWLEVGVGDALQSYVNLLCDQWRADGRSDTLQSVAALAQTCRDLVARVEVDQKAVATASKRLLADLAPSVSWSDVDTSAVVLAGRVDVLGKDGVVPILRDFAAGSLEFLGAVEVARAVRTVCDKLLAEKRPPV